MYAREGNGQSPLPFWGGVGGEAAGGEVSPLPFWGGVGGEAFAKTMPFVLQNERLPFLKRCPSFFACLPACCHPSPFGEGLGERLFSFFYRMKRPFSFHQRGGFVD